MKVIELIAYLQKCDPLLDVRFSKFEKEYYQGFDSIHGVKEETVFAGIKNTKNEETGKEETFQTFKKIVTLSHESCDNYGTTYIDVTPREEVAVEP